MKISYVLAAQLWIGVGLIVPIGITIYGGQFAYMPGIIFSIAVINIFLVLVNLLQKNGEYESQQKIIPPDRAAIISFFAWNFFAAFIFFWEKKQDVMALIFWVIGGGTAYFLPLFILWMHVLIKGKVDD